MVYFGIMSEVRGGIGKFIFQKCPNQFGNFENLGESEFFRISELKVALRHNVIYNALMVFGLCVFV